MKTFILVTGLFYLTNTAFAQKSSVHPYIGASLNLLGVSTFGWGIDCGMKFTKFYTGIEYGSYGHEINVVTAPYGVTPHPIFEDFYGLHGGIVVSLVLSCGLVFLYSEHHSYDGTISHFINVGPDVRLQSDRHLIFGIAYTIRRGLNAGINFAF